MINDFAIRSFRETADKDYIAARMAYRANLIQPFLWSALHCLEKYVKCVLLLNRVEAHRGHSVLPGIEKMKRQGKFAIDLSANTIQFIKKLEDYGAEYRYYEVSYIIEPFDLVRFDHAVWELRRYCQPLDCDIVDASGKTVNLLSLELDRVHLAKTKFEKGTCITGGVLEKIIEKKDHPAREALIWNNLFFGPSRRKGVKMRPSWESGNSPFFLNPEIIDEVLKYVYIPKAIAEGVRQFAIQKAAEKAKEERDAKKSATAAARQSGKTS
ncbi:HEPN domain-containing protein [Undibacterium sp. TC4M20W]|uniref:HEPN domain-containing protein n=1 Tax=Undibacterium sp. TC4M20W TaxID=3413052 RepID=UPI003BF60CA8